MKKPKNVNDALDKLHIRLLATGVYLERYLLNPQEYSLEHIEEVKDAVLDAHMLVTWIKDNIK